MFFVPASVHRSCLTPCALASSGEPSGEPSVRQDATQHPGLESARHTLQDRVGRRKANQAAHRPGRAQPDAAPPGGGRHIRPTCQAAGAALAQEGGTGRGLHGLLTVDGWLYFRGWC